jgi:hypothetical protein
MKMATVAVGVAWCALGCAQAFAGPLDHLHAIGPAELRNFTAAGGVLSRIGVSGLPPAIRPLDMTVGNLDLIDHVPLLSHTATEMVLVRHGSGLWIEPRS